MEEESERRRGRLQALRREADEAGVHDNSESRIGGPYILANPLIEPTASPFANAEPQAAPRFDFYTDPMAAFSANKRGKVSNQISPDYFAPPRGPDMTNSLGRPAYQAQTTYSADPRMVQSPQPYHRPGLSRSPMGTPNPYGTPQVSTNNGCGSTGTPTYIPSNFPRGGSIGSPGFAPGGSPYYDGGFGRGYGHINNPKSGYGNSASPGGSPNYNGGFGRGYGHINSPESGYGNSGSPYPNSGRGQSRWLGNNCPQGSGRGGRSPGQGNKTPFSGNGGRGRADSHYSLSAEKNPGRFYNKSMVEDPWAMLKPVVRRKEDAPTTSLGTHDSKKSWLPESISGKKAQVSEVVHKYSSGRSFAEDLAASFHAATSHESADDDNDDDVE